MAEHEDRSRSPCRDVSPTQRQRSPGSVSPTQVVLDEEMAGIDEVVLQLFQQWPKFHREECVSFLQLAICFGSGSAAAVLFTLVHATEVYC